MATGQVTWREYLSVDSGEPLDDTSTIGKVRIQYKSEELNDGWDSEANIAMASDLSEGIAYTTDSIWDSETQGPIDNNYQIAFNDRYVKSKNITAGTAANIYDQEQFKYKIYDYGVYNKTDGSAVELDGSFSLNIQIGDETYQGWASYWGIWSEPGLDLANATITDNKNNTYTIYKAPGRLVKHTRQIIALAELDLVELSVWNNDGENVIRWNETYGVFQKIATTSWDCNDNGCTFNRIDLDTPVAQSASDFNEWTEAWSDSLRTSFPIGKLFTVNNESVAAPTGETTMSYSTQTNVAPGTLDSDLTLITYDYTGYTGKITKASLTADNNGNVTSDKVSEWDWNNVDWDNLTIDDYKNEYFFDKDSMTLHSGTSKVAGKEVIFDTDVSKEDVSNSNFSWGLWINNAIPVSDAVHDNLTIDNFWQAGREANISYSWETGFEEWNKTTALKNADNTFKTINPPIEIPYTHETINDLDDSDKHNNKKFVIRLDGDYVDLPWEYDAEIDQWRPQFALKNKVILNPNDDESSQYIVKALNGQKSMLKVDSVSPGSIEPQLNTTFMETGIDLSIVDAVLSEKPPMPTGDLEVRVVKGVTQTN